MNARTPRTRAQSGDPTLFELLMLPVLMGGLSLMMWFSLPTSGEVLTQRRGELDLRHAAIVTMARSLEGGRTPATPTCGHVQPRPAYLEENREQSNTLILGGRELTALVVPVVVPSELDLLLADDLYYLIESRNSVSTGGRPMTRNRIADEIERPLATRYVLLYATRMLEPLAQTADASVQGRVAVEAFLFDFGSMQPLCTLAFVVAMDPAFQTSGDFDGMAHSTLWTLTRNELVSRLTSSEHVP